MDDALTLSWQSKGKGSFSEDKKQLSLQLIHINTVFLIVPYESICIVFSNVFVSVFQIYFIYH